jgi:hypothetical protein
MTRRTLLSVPFAAAGLRAGLQDDDGDDIRALLNAAAGALRDRSEEQFLAAFDPAMKNYRQLRANIHQLLRDADVEANIGIASTELDWSLEITAHDLAAGVTHRKGKATYTTRRIGENLRIASFEPISLFGPPHGREAWDAVSELAADLQLASRAAEGREENNIPNVLSRFDPATAEYPEVEVNVRGLASTWVIEPALQLTSNEGDDERRSLEIDWAMTLTNPVDKGRSLRKEETVKCVIAKRGKKWLIVSFAPLALLGPPPL